MYLFIIILVILFYYVFLHKRKKENVKKKFNFKFWNILAYLPVFFSYMFLSN